MASSCASAASSAVFGLGAQCAVDSDFSFFVITQAPTPRQIARICSSPKCSQAIAAIRSAVSSECTIPSGDTSFQLYKDILNPIAAACSKGSVVVTGPPSSTATNATEATASSPSCGKALTDATFDHVQCTADSNYSFFVITALPTASQIARICASSNCTVTISAIKTAVPSECATGGVSGQAFQLYKQILDPIDATCGQTSNTTTSTTEPETVTTAPTSSPDAKTTNVPAPAPTKSSGASLASTLSVALVLALAVLQTAC